WRNSGKGTECEILTWAEKLEDSINSVGVHASGIVISNSPLDEKVPLFVGKRGEVTTQWEMNNIEEVGLIKFDFLGLDALDKIHRCIDIVKKTKNIDIDIDSIDLEDEKTFAKLRAGEAEGIFQLEASSGMRDLLVQIRPTSIEDLIALVAIFRPGPLAAPYKPIYLDVRAGKRDPEYLVPELEPILKRTDGWCIYQEQVMEIARELCGYTMAEADDLRKAMGKKIQSMMDKHEPKFKKGWESHGLAPTKADTLWKELEKFASYAFNRSHAAAYAYITYQTAYLKTHYPTEYMCAVLTSEAGNKDQMIKSLAECRRMNIQVLPPDINTSEASFSVDKDGNIRFGLGPVKNLGESPVQAIIEERKSGRFTSLRNFCDRVDLGVVNRLKLTSLIRAGAFDEFGENRFSLFSAVEPIWDYREETKRYKKKLDTYHKKMEQCEQRKEDISLGKLSEKGKKLKPLKPPVMPERPDYPTFEELDEMPEHEIQAAEHELLGFYVTSHPLDHIASMFGDSLNRIEDTKELPQDTQVALGVVLTNVHEITTKAKKRMAFVTLEDLTGSIEGVVFPRLYDKYAEQLDSMGPFRVNAKVEVTETDEDRVAKLIVQGIHNLDLKQKFRPEKIEAHVKVTQAADLAKALEKYPGNLHEVSICLVAEDGTKFRNKGTRRIGNYKGAFMRELMRLNNE
ncbi:MAG: DNA polymerase III subunit alpha, partial [Candidatus Bathyarchaeota archaeon]|nr:DNA polymerase III subunit alpha [Candidatus Bathyarchaeota archaeon]